MLTRKVFSEEEILKIFNEEVGEEEEEEMDDEMEDDMEDDENESSVEDLDLDSMSDSEKIQLAIDVLSSCDVDVDDIIESLKDFMDSMGEE